MAVSKIKFLWKSVKLETFLCSNVYRRTQLKNLTCSRCYSTDNTSCTSASNEVKINQNLQQIPKKHRKPSVVDEKDRELIEILKAGKDPFYPHSSSYEKVVSDASEALKELSSKTVKISTGVKLNFERKPLYPPETDIVIIGCNAVSLSIAFAFRERFPDTPNILIIDKDEKFPHASTNIGQSMLIQQLFTDEEEISMNKYAAEFLQSFPRRLAVEGQPRFKLPYEPLGSLLLADETNAEKILQQIKILRSHGVQIKILDGRALKQRFPWLKLDNVLFGSLGMSKEGIYDPWSFLIGLRCKAINLGVQFMTAEVLDFGIDEDRIPKRIVCKLPNGGYHCVNFSICILACGVESLNLVDILNSSNLGPFTINLPLEERMRYEYCFYSPKGPGLDTPIVIGSDGTYFRREGLCNYYVAGVPCVKHSEDENIEPYDVFMTKVKPFLAERVPQFDQIDLVKGWIDSYDFCVSNEVGILGPHPSDWKIFFALGFSHVGMRYAPAIGRAVMEYIAYEDYRTLDLQRYHIDNLWKKQHSEAKRKKQESIESQERISISE